MKDFAPLQRWFDLPTDQVQDGDYPVVYSNGILRNHKTYKAKAPWVVTWRSGTIWKVSFVENDYRPHNTSLRVTDFKNNYPKFVFYFYANFGLEKFWTWSWVPTLNRNDVHTQSRYFPSYPEQTKIANFLTAVDAKIVNLTILKSEREKYKTGAMQQIFSQQIRFKDEEGNDFTEWEEKKLGECLWYIQPTKYIVESVEYSDEYKVPVLTAGKTFILWYTNEESWIFSEKLPCIIFDDFTTANKYVDFPFKVKSSAMKILIAKEWVDIKFMFEAMQLFKLSLWDDHKRYWISEYSNFDLFIPSLAEQQRIADFLSNIDQKISELNQQIEKMKDWKKGLLQGLFI